MKRKIRLKGQLKTYMYWPLIMTVLIVLMNIPVYYVNRKAGICVSVFTIVYFLVILAAYFVNKPAIALNENHQFLPPSTPRYRSIC